MKILGICICKGWYKILLILLNDLNFWIESTLEVKHLVFSFQNDICIVVTVYWFVKVYLWQSCFAKLKQLYFYKLIFW